MLNLACVIIVIAGLKAAQTLIIPILLAIFVAVVSYPITKALMRIRVPRGIAVFCTVILDCGFLVGLAFLINYLAGDLKRTLISKYVPLFTEKYADLSIWLKARNMDGALSNLGELISPDKIMGLSGQIFSVAAMLLSVTILVIILMTFFLGETHVYIRNLSAIIEQQGPNFKKTLKASGDIQRYLLIKTIISLITGALAFTLCYFTHIDFALLWGLVAFALNFIPTIGSIVAAIPPIILGLLLANPATAIIVALGYLAINMTLGNFLEPMLLGKQFGIATAVVLLSVLFWGFIWGPIGMLLAVPLTMIIKLALENSQDFHWISILISKTPISENLPTHTERPLS